ncbi:hypothetical protein BD410DRAFT_135290 [Rickenella mellea]|uniref:Uncharacterized protein n=1 Tax=Rickenella mellea TaxID=50990 RepID=A0A4Y7PKW6_9AGAM|nr:hypothetical protein BD410DRAFT_135290 [Rickenella mellea]
MLDIFVFGFTFGKTIRHTMEMRKVGLEKGLGYFILRDGALYFLAKLLFGIFGTTVFFVSATEYIDTWLSLTASINNPLSVILVNRLVLNLRQVSHLQGGNAPTLSAINTTHEPEFATNSLLGNLGAPLRVEDEEIGETSLDVQTEVVEKGGIVVHCEIIKEPHDRSYV